MRGKKWGKFLVENSQIWGKNRDFYMENDPTAGSQLHPEGLGEDVSGIPEILRHPGEAGSHRDLPQRLPGKSLLLKTGKKTLENPGIPRCCILTSCQGFVLTQLRIFFSESCGISSPQFPEFHGIPVIFFPLNKIPAAELFPWKCPAMGI